MNMEKGIYTPKRSPDLAAGLSGKHSARILLHDEEQGGNGDLNIDDERSSEYNSSRPATLEDTQIIDDEKVVTALNILLNKQ